MNKSHLFLAALDRIGVPYQLFEHPPVSSIWDCLAMPFIDSDTVMCKNIFLCDSGRKHFYLLLMEPRKPFVTRIVSKNLFSSRLSFAPDEYLPELLALEKGAVSPLGLLFDKEHRVHLACDLELKKALRVAFHPGIRTATVIFDAKDFWERVLPAVGIQPLWISCEEIISGNS